MNAGVFSKIILGIYARFNFAKADLILYALDYAIYMNVKLNI